MTRRRRTRKAKSGGGLKVAMAIVAGVSLVGVGAYLGVEAVSEPSVSAEVTPAPWSEGRVRVEVLNIGGVSGMGRDATESLRDAGFDVVELGNVLPFDADRESLVIDRVGRTDVAHAVAKALGIDNVQSDPDPNLYVDVSVLLGSAWAANESTMGANEVVRARSRWDPRGWFGR